MAQIPAGQSCAQCKYFIQGTCHYFPPTFIPGDSRAGIADRFAWPSVKGSDWCGAFMT